jgi:nitrate/nitrite-specific signal transduction histidine kinase
MRRSINFFIPFFIALLLFLATVILFSTSTYFFYQSAIKQLVAKGFWIEVDLSSLKETMFRISLWQGIVVFFVLSIVYIIIYFILRSAIFIPLRNLHETITKIRKGDLEAKAIIKTENEIGELAEAFNKMIEDLRRYQDELYEAKQVLEIKVSARTRELQELADSQEEIIKTKTKDLLAKIAELERFQRLTVGRELKMIELKEKIKQLSKSRK